MLGEGVPRKHGLPSGVGELGDDPPSRVHHEVCPAEPSGGLEEPSLEDLATDELGIGRLARHGARDGAKRGKGGGVGLGASAV